MSVKKKISTEKLREQIIMKGEGSIECVQEKKDEPQKWEIMSLRIRKDIKGEIDEVRKKRVGITRNAWILEAIQEKLLKEGVPHDLPMC